MEKKGLSLSDRVATLVVALAAAVTATPAVAGSFTAGDLVIYRVGDGSGPLSNTGAAVFLDEYTPTGTLVQSIEMPTTVSGMNNPLIAGGTATLEGGLNLSPNGQYLTFTGYDAALGSQTSSLASSASTTIPRVVAIVGASGSRT